MQLTIAENVTAYLRRSSRRKTIALKVRNAEVTVYAPHHAALSEIQAFVDSKANWVSKHLQQQRTQKLRHTPNSLQPGEKLSYLGQAYPIRSCSKTGNVKLTEQHLLLPEKLVKQKRSARQTVFAQWYLNKALAYIAPKVAKYAALMAVEPKGIKVRHYKSRWGSCNSRGELQFNWVIMMAPPDVIDYVIVHELAHLKHFNHSNAFWALVAQHLPNFEEHRAWLKQQNALQWD